MKKIGIDARLYFQTGVGVYIRNLIHYLSALNTTELEIYLYIYKPDSEKIKIQNPKFKIRLVNAKWHSLAEQTIFFDALTQDNLDLMHFTYFSYPARYNRPFISTVHDVTPLLFKTGRASTHNPFVYELKHMAFKYVLKSQVKNAKKIITPTKYVREELGKIYGKSIFDKTSVIYEGVNFEVENGSVNFDLIKKYPDKFFLTVTNFFPHKNAHRLIEAYSGLITSVPLLFVGPENVFVVELKKFVKINNIKNVHFFHSATISDLLFFYKHATALVAPSLSEGFGLPLLEAASNGCQVIASDLPVFREILGDLYSKFDPYSTTDIQNVLKKHLNNPSKFNYNDILKKYSFKHMAENILEIYKELA